MGFEKEEGLWSPFVSFCFITNGAKPEKLRLALESVRALNIPKYEIILSGRPPIEFAAKDVKFVELPDAADNGQLGAMRNAACRIATGDLFVVSDDDMLFQADFYQGLCAFGPDFDVAGCRVLNTDGSRFWDYAVVNSPTGHHLIPYSQKSDFVYITGGLAIVRPHLFAAVQWDSERGFYRDEDVDFTKRVRDAGFRIGFNQQSSVIHNDDLYFRLDNRVELRSLPARWKKLVPGVFVQGAYRLVSDYFFTGRVFKIAFAEQTALKQLSFSLVPLASIGNCRNKKNSAKVEIDGIQIGEAQLETDIVNVSLTIEPGTKLVTVTIGEPEIPAIWGAGDSGYFGVFVRGFKIEGLPPGADAFTAPENVRTSRDRIIAPILDDSEISLALRESILNVEKSGERFSFELARSSAAVTFGSQEELYQKIKKFDPGLEIERHAFFFHDGAFEVSSNFFRPHIDRWHRGTFLGPAAIVDEDILGDAAQGRFRIGVPSIEDAESLFERGLTTEQVLLVPLYPDPAQIKVRAASRNQSWSKIFVNMRWGGAKDISKIISSLPKEFNGPVIYRFWVGSPFLEEEVRRALQQQGFDLERVAILSGAMPDEYLDLVIGESDLAVCWSAHDPYGYFVRRLIATGIPVLGNRIGARREIEYGFSEVSRVEDLKGLIEQVLAAWELYHADALQLRKELEQMPRLGDFLRAISEDAEALTSQLDRASV